MPSRPERIIVGSSPFHFTGPSRRHASRRMAGRTIRSTVSSTRQSTLSADSLPARTPRHHHSRPHRRPTIRCRPAITTNPQIRPERRRRCRPGSSHPSSPEKVLDGTDAGRGELPGRHPVEDPRDLARRVPLLDLPGEVGLARRVLQAPEGLHHHAHRHLFRGPVAHAAEAPLVPVCHDSCSRAGPGTGLSVPSGEIKSWWPGLWHSRRREPKE